MNERSVARRSLSSRGVVHLSFRHVPWTLGWFRWILCELGWFRWVSAESGAFRSSKVQYIEWNSLVVEWLGLKLKYVWLVKMRGLVLVVALSVVADGWSVVIPWLRMLNRCINSAVLGAEGTKWSTRENQEANRTVYGAHEVNFIFVLSYICWYCSFWLKKKRNQNLHLIFSSTLQIITFVCITDKIKVTCSI